MKTICQKYTRIIDTTGSLKGEKGYYFSIDVDTEPCINTAWSHKRDGYLCYNCSKDVARILQVER